jgi:hypothetical protein
LREFRFDPQTPVAPSTVPPPIDEAGLGAVACPSVSQCTAVDEVGREVTFDPNAPIPVTGTVTVGGAPQSPVAPLHAIATPSMTQVGQSHRRWREGTALARLSRTRPRADRARTLKAPVGTTLSFSLNLQATVSFRFTRSLPGRKVGHGCVAQTTTNRDKPSCKREITEGTLSFSAHRGVNKVAFQGRISRFKRLALGNYTLVVTATTTAGRRSQPKSLSFTIVR